MNKKHAYVLLPAFLLLVAAADFARQWPLQLMDVDAGAYAVTLPVDTYRGATDAGLRDIDVVDADARAVPAAVLPIAGAFATDTQWTALPWFALPTESQRGGLANVAVVSERDAAGRVLRIRAQVDTNDAAPAQSWLLDASGIAQPVRALRLQWAPHTQPLDIAYRVEASDDLRRWWTVQGDARLLDLARDGQRLLQTRIELDGSARYLRLLPNQPEARATLQLTGVFAQSTVAKPTQWQWRLMQPVSQSEAKQYQFQLDGRFPIVVADVELPGNAAGVWRLDSRDSTDAPWQPRVGPWTVFSVGQNANSDRSEPQALSFPVRDRYWRLTAAQAGSATPTLRLGYLPERIVFVASGRAPYRLVAGSTNKRRADAPMDELLTQLRTRRGAQWQPALALVGQGAELAGKQALRPPPPDWKRWLLWAALAAGAIVVALFALSLLREPKHPVQNDS